MAKLTFFAFFVFVTACSTVKEGQRYFYFVDAFSEEDIELHLKNDGSFVMEDRYGCNQFKLVGKYREITNVEFKSIVFDSISYAKTSNKSLFGSEKTINKFDTAWIINSERLYFRNKPFIYSKKNHRDLEEIRFQKLRDHYVDLLGKKGYMKVFGGGNKSEARKRLLRCDQPDIKFK